MVRKRLFLIVAVFFALVAMVAIVFAIVRAFQPTTSDQVPATPVEPSTSSQVEITNLESIKNLPTRTSDEIKTAIFHQLEETGAIDSSDQITGTLEQMEGTETSARRVFMATFNQKKFRVTYDRNQTSDYRIQVECQGSDGSFGGYYCVQH